MRMHAQRARTRRPVDWSAVADLLIRKTTALPAAPTRVLRAALLHRRARLPAGRRLRGNALPLQQRTQGQVVPDAFTHGTSEQRVRWFSTGFETGQPGRCDTFKAARL